MQKIFNLYKNAYGGLSEAAWMLALVMLINRAGSMVMPFLSLYLTQSLNFSIQDTGIVLAAYGLGAMAGSLLGGWLSDKFGNFWIQFLSLTTGGTFLMFVPMIYTFEWLVPAVFLASLLIECLRPANMASVAGYSKPENVTRSFSLNRMAINLGFSVGPAFGGFLAAHSFELLFYVDGITCISAGLFFYFYFRNKTPRNVKQDPRDVVSKPAISPYQDKAFIFFVLLVTCFAIVFFQLFNTLPIYYREVHLLSEGTIGILLGLNGMIVFFFEMILVNQLESKVPILRMIVFGTILCGFAYAILNFSTGIILLVISMFLLSFSEIMAMPFMVTYVVKRAGEGKRGAYIGLYSLSWASAFMLAPYLGTRLLAHNTFELLWWMCALMSLVTGFLFYLNLKASKKPVLEPELPLS